MAPDPDADAAVEHLVELDDRGLLPFAWWQIGPRSGRVEVVVPESDRQAALAWFAEHPLQPGTRVVPVDVRVRAGASWSSEPVRGASHRPDPDALVGLVGLDVNRAAAAANAGGWVVRAHEPEAVLTAELRTNRVNLEYSARGRVVAVRIG